MSLNIIDRAMRVVQCVTANSGWVSRKSHWLPGTTKPVQRKTQTQLSHGGIITARKRSCGKVMFLHLYVSPSIHAGGLCMMSLLVWLPGPLFLLGVSVSGPIFLPGGLADIDLPQTEIPLDRDPPDRDPPGQRPPDQRPPCTVKSGWYASYWNAFLVVVVFAFCPQILGKWWGSTNDILSVCKCSLSS